jgi:hypothetical protein
MLTMSISNYDMDQLMGTYADWIAWLKEKQASLAGQLSRMKGQEKEAASSEPGVPVVAEAQPALESPAAAVEELPTAKETPETPPAPVAAAEEADSEDWL